jgi:formate dehydrogenase subunit gamma
MRRDLRRVSYWTRDELAWLRTLGRRPLDADKFNPGQKFNTLFVGASSLIMLGSGVILQWFHFFPVSWRGGATFVHDTLAYVVVAMIVGHLYMAMTHLDALVSIFNGRVERAWAKKNAPAWAREIDESSVDPSQR